MARLLLLVPLLVMGCKTSRYEGEGPCYDLCRSLVEDCGYAAYPTFESCLQGCLYNQEQGAQTVKEASCVEDANCDTFAIVECEHAFGID